MNIRDSVVAYIKEICHDPLPDQSINLFESGLLTSLDVLSIVSFLERTFGLHITGDDIEWASFSTIDGLVTLVAAMQGRAR